MHYNISTVISLIFISNNLGSTRCRICSCMICRCCIYNRIICYNLRCCSIRKSGLSCSAQCIRCMKLCSATLFNIFYYYISHIFSLILISYYLCSSMCRICSCIICRCRIYNFIICYCSRSCIISCTCHSHSAKIFICCK